MDLIDDAIEVAALVPGSRFATALRRDRGHGVLSIAGLDPWPEELLATPPISVPLRRAGPAPRLRIEHPTGGGEVVTLPIGRWHGPVPCEERQVLGLGAQSHP